MLKFCVFIISFIFLLQGPSGALLSDLISSLHNDDIVTNSSCHTEHTESSTQPHDCEDCFHAPTCCHVKLTQSHLKYDLSPSFDSTTFQEFHRLFLTPPVLDGPFQPPKLT